MFLGLDLGTSGLKGLLMDEDQQIVGTQTATLSISRPHEGWSEQDPHSWIIAGEAVITSLCASHPQEMGALKGIGLSGQMHGATILDDADKPLRPCILWNDTRSFSQAERLDVNPIFRAQTGNIVFPGFTAPKIDWVRENEGSLFDKTSKILLPKDYLRLWLSGEYISDMSDASGTSWLDVKKRDWSDQLLGVTGLDRSHMPMLVEGSDPGGILRPALASKWGLPKGIVIAGGAGDNAASAIGMGTIQAGQSFISLGTSGVLFAATSDFRPNPDAAIHSFCHALPNKWHQMGVILSATDCLEWLSTIVGASAETLTTELGNTLVSPGATRFLPYLSGERTPYNDAKIRGAFLGLSRNIDRPALTRAVLEGVAFAFKDSLRALKSSGTEIDRVLAIGGGSRSSYWLNLLSNILNIPVDLPQDGDYGAAFGAARLGLMARLNEKPETVCTAPKIKRTIDPDPIISAKFAQAYQSYTQLYPALKGL
jgi:xylulokinase